MLTFLLSHDVAASFCSAVDNVFSWVARAAPLAFSALVRAERTAEMREALRHLLRSSWSRYARASEKLAGHSIFG